MKINEMVQKAHANARDKGWWPEDEVHNIPEKLALIHSEVSEALEQYRDGNPMVWDLQGKPEGFAVELADVVIRIGDLCGHLGIDLADVIAKKMAYNATRQHRHGGKKC